MSDRMRVRVRLAAVVAPVGHLRAVLAGLARRFLASPSAALVLVPVVVIVAAVARDRIAWVLADGSRTAPPRSSFFLTAPYSTDSPITDRDDIETAVLLLAMSASP